MDHRWKSLTQFGYFVGVGIGWHLAKCLVKLFWVKSHNNLWNVTVFDCLIKPGCIKVSISGIYIYADSKNLRQSVNADASERAARQPKLAIRIKEIDQPATVALKLDVRD